MKQLLYAGLLLAFFSCKKSDNSDSGNTNNTINTTTPTAAQLMGTYKQTAETKNGNDSWNTSGGVYEACDLDDTYTLGANNILTRNDAGTVCNPSNSGTGGWLVNGNIFKYWDGLDYSIQSFDGTTLKIRYSTGSGSSAFTIEKTLVKQ